MKKLTLSLITVFLTLLGCINNKVEKCLPDISAPNTENLVLTLSLNNNFKNMYQTVFIETQEYARMESIFAIGAKIHYTDFSKCVYKEVIFKDFKLQTLMGKNLYITDATYAKKGEEHKIYIDVDSTQSGDVKEIEIPHLKTEEKIVVEVSYDGTYGIGSRICTNYIGSLAR